MSLLIAFTSKDTNFYKFLQLYSTLATWKKDFCHKFFIFNKFKSAKHDERFLLMLPYPRVSWNFYKCLTKTCGTKLYYRSNTLISVSSLISHPIPYCLCTWLTYIQNACTKKSENLSDFLALGLTCSLLFQTHQSSSNLFLPLQ